MKCKNCQRELPDGTKFCPSCGLSQIDGIDNQYSTSAKTSSLSNLVKLFGKLNNKQKVIVVSILGGILAVAILTYVVLLMPSKLLISELKNYHVVGYNGYGYLVCDEDESNPIFKRKNEIDMSYTTTCIVNDKECEKLGTESRLIDLAYNSIACEYANENGTLSNGDVVHVVCTANPVAFKELGYKITGLEFDVVAENLPESEIVDFFEGYSLSWEWNGSSYELVESGITEYMEKFDYYTSSPYNGYVTVKLNITVDELKNYGLIPTDESLSAEIYVGDTPYRVTSTYDEDIEALKIIADARLDQYIDKCGWNLYVGNNVEVIYDKTFLNIDRYYYSSLYAYYDIVTDKGTYQKSIELNDIYKLSDGTYVDHGNFDSTNAACQVSGGKWIN